MTGRPRRETPDRPATVILPSPLGGVGTFAAELIPRGAVILSLTGEIVMGPELDSRPRRGLERQDDSIRVGDDLYVDLDRESNSINHSCDPTAGVRGQTELFALRDILPDEEITFDYATTVTPIPDEPGDTPYPEGNWRMEGCRCGSPRCRGTIGSVLTIPAAELRRYRQLGALPDLVASFFLQEAAAARRERPGPAS
jgi:SET domain-containing protein